MGVAAVVGDETSRPWLSCGQRKREGGVRMQALKRMRMRYMISTVASCK